MKTDHVSCLVLRSGETVGLTKGCPEPDVGRSPGKLEISLRKTANHYRHFTARRGLVRCGRWTGPAPPGRVAAVDLERLACAPLLLNPQWRVQVLEVQSMARLYQGGVGNCLRSALTRLLYLIKQQSGRRLQLFFQQIGFQRFHPTVANANH